MVGKFGSLSMVFWNLEALLACWLCSWLLVILMFWNASGSSWCWFWLLQMCAVVLWFGGSAVVLGAV
jgi:hypothetical protein